MPIDFKLPNLGENTEAGDVVSVLVAEGDVIEKEQNVLELETDKAIVELPSPHAGRVLKVHVQPGDHVPVGTVILTIEDAEVPVAAGVPVRRPQPDTRSGPPPSRPSSIAHPQADVPAAHPPESSSVPRPATRPMDRPPAPAGPATRRLARELGVDLYQVTGTASGGRITREDVKVFVRQKTSAAPPQAPAPTTAPPLPDFSQWGPVQRQPMSTIRRKTAENVSLAWRLVPHVTQFDLADITELEAARRRYVENHADQPGKVTITVLATKAVVAALKAYPQFNASLDAGAGELILKQYYHIGVAVDTEHGLLVPVIRDANRKNIRQLAVELEDLAGRARDRKIQLEELRGGTFTITNLGGIGGTAFSPIVNYPEVAVLGLARSRQEQVIRAGKPEIRLMLPLCLSYDHRVIDGADGARFLRKLAGMLSEPLELLLEA